MLKRSTSRVTLTKSIKFFLSPRTLLLIAAILALTPLQIFSFLIILGVATRLLPFGQLGVVTRALLSFSISMCVVCFIAVSAWLIKVPLTAPIILLILIAMVACLYIAQSKKGTIPPANWHTNRYELIALCVSALAMFLITTPVQQHTNAASMLRAISAGGDNSAHIAMIKTSDLNQGVAYGLDNRFNPPGSAVNYPQGWHFNVAFYKWMSDPLVHYQYKPGRLLLLIYATSVAWFGLLVFFIARLALRLVEYLPGKKHPLALLGAAAVVGGITLHWLLQLFTHGFQAQTASLTLLVIEVLLLAEAFNRPADKRYPLLLLATVAAVACNFVWVFIMPITCGAVGVCLIATVISLKKIPPLSVILALALLGALALLQPLFYLIYPVQFEFPIILQRGDINEVSMLALLTVFCISLGYALLRWRQKPMRVVLLVAAGSLLFAFGLMVHQLQEIHELRYFFYKSTYTFIVLGGALVAVVAYDLLQYALSTIQLKRIATGCAAALIVITSGLVLWQVKDPITDTFADGSFGGMSGPQALALIDQITKGPEIAADTIFIGSCNRGDDIRASLFIAALIFDPIQRKTSFDPGAHDEKVVFGTIKKAIDDPDRHITVVSGDQVVFAHFKEYLGDDFPRISVINLDMTPETEPISQCPDRTRANPLQTALK